MLVGFATLKPVLAASLLIVGALFVTGCPAQRDYASNAWEAASRHSIALGGSVFGGRQALADSSVTAYATATAIGAMPIQIGIATTDVNGAFELTFSPAPTTGQIIYLIARGGDAGAGPNPAIGMVSVAGSFCVREQAADVRCAFSSNVNINELATVAVTATLKHDFRIVDCNLITGNTRFGQCVVLVNSPGLGARVRSIASLVDVESGEVSNFLAAQPTTSTNPIHVTLQKFQALANILAACINSNSGPACDKLFSVTLGRPVNTLAAALDIAAWPGVNLKSKALFDLMPASTFFQAAPALLKPPTDWTLAGNRYVYVSDIHSGKLSAWQQSWLTGALVPLPEGGAGACSTQAWPLAPDPMNCIDVSAAPTALALDPADRFLWTVDNSSQTIRAYARDPASGALVATDQSLAVAGEVSALTLSPTGERLYAAFTTLNEVVVYAVGADGALSVIAAAPTGTQPSALAIAPSGRFLYAASQNANRLFMYAIGADGGLTRMGTVPVDPGTQALAVSSSGQRLYAAVPARSRILTYSIQADGALVKLGEASVTGTPTALAVDSSQRFVYAIDAAHNKVIGYGVVPGGGLGNVPIARVSTGVDPGAIGIAGEFLYVTNQGGNSVSAWHVRQTASASGTAAGTLAPIRISASAPAGSYTDAVVVEPTGRYVYAVNAGCHDLCVGTTGSVSSWRLDALTGGLVPLAFGPFQAGESAELIAIDPSGRSVYVANRGDGGGHSSVSAWSVDSSSGALTHHDSYSLPGGTGSYSIAVAPDGEHVYTANYDGGSIAIFARQKDGSLAFLQLAPVSGSGPLSVAITPDGQYLYTANHTSDDVSADHLSPATGLLEWQVTGAPFPASASTDWIAIDPVAPYLYVVNFADDNVSGYRIGPDGSLAPLPGSPFAVGAGKNPRAIAVDPLGRYVFTANHTSNDVSAWLILANGSLQAVVGSPFPAGHEPLAITVDPSGRYVYTANHSGDDVAAFVILSTGALAPVAASTPFAAGAGPKAIVISP